MSEPDKGPAADRPVVSAEWLATHLRDPNVRVFDATYFLPNEAGDPRGGYEAEHIPGAVFFDIDAVADPSSDLPHMLPSAEQFARDVGALGVSNDDAVVVYDQRGLFSAARVWWSFRVFGHEAVAVLDGGLPRWKALGQPVESGSVEPEPRRFVAHEDPGLVRRREEVRSALASGAEQVLDVRPAGRFRGDDPEPRAGLRSGHMPGAVNLPFRELLRDDGTLHSPDELRARFEGAGVDLERPLTTSCGSGLTAALAALAAQIAGHPRAAVYDGSWAEWGRPDSGEDVVR